VSTFALPRASAVPPTSTTQVQASSDVATWYLYKVWLPPPTTVTVPYGLHDYVPVAGDWDGPQFGGWQLSIDTMGVYDNGWWYLRNSNTPGPPDIVVNFGTTGYTPVVGDFGLGVFVDGWWYLRGSYTPGPPTQVWQFGVPGDIPIPGKWFITYQGTSPHSWDEPGVIR
jgi:hypothetical protein